MVRETLTAEFGKAITALNPGEMDEDGGVNRPAPKATLCATQVNSIDGSHSMTNLLRGYVRGMSCAQCC